MTRQTYDRAPRLTKLATAHISKGVIHTHTRTIYDRFWMDGYDGYVWSPFGTNN